MRKYALAVWITVFCLLASAFLSGAPAVAAKPADEFRVLDISERTYDNGPALAVIFSRPLDPTKRYDELLRVSDEKEMVKGAWVLSGDHRVLYYPHVEPETVYSIAVLKDLTSADGASLDRRYFKAVTTRKITPVVTFASDGLVLPEKLSEGLPVTVVNVKTVEVEFFRMNEKGLQRFVRWRNPNQRHEYDEIDNARNYGEFVYSGRYDLDPPKNRRVTRFIPVMEEKALQAPGVYFAVLREPGEYDYDYKATYFIVTDIGLHARVYPDQAQVMASSLTTGEPLAGVKLELYNNKARVIARGETDADGVFQYKDNLFKKKVSFLLARNNGHTAVLPFRIPALDLSEFELGYRVQRPREIFVYSPRDLYRPGETVTVSALFRDYDGRPAESMPLQARLIRPDGRRVRSFTWHPESGENGPAGYYQTALDIPAGSQTGRWRLELKDNPGSRGPTGIFSFQVEDFMPERMKLDLASPQEYIAGDSDWKVDVTGMYLYGAPAAGNNLEAKVRMRARRDLFPKLDGFRFGDENDKGLSDYWELKAVDLDKEGKAGLTVESKWAKIGSPVSVRVMASLFETGGRPVNRGIERIVWPADRLIGIRPMFDGSSVKKGGVGFEVVRVKPDGSFVAAEGLQVTLIKEDRDYYWEYSESRGWRHKYTEKKYVFQKDLLGFDGEKPAEYRLDLDEGWYLLAVKDPETNLTSSVRFRVGYWWYAGDRRSAARPDKVTIELDKPGYLPGDVIRLTVKPPHSGDARILVEGRSPLWFKRLPVSAKGTTVEIPVSAAWDSHDIYISAVVFRPGAAEEKITPNRAVGVVHLPLDRVDRKLELSIESPERVAPQKPTPVTAKIKLGKKPEGAVFVTLAAVDVGILSITDFKTPDPFGWFFQQRRYGVDSYDLYGKVIELLDGRMANVKCGGDADTTPGGKRPETKVKLVTIFQGPVAFDENGEADVTMIMPHDFNGRLRFMAVAFGPDSFGSAESEMTVAAPVVTQLSTPRLMAPSDECTFSLDVHNMSGQDRDLTVRLTADVPLELKDGERTVSLKDKEKTTLRYPVKALDGFAGSVIRLQVEGEGISIGREWQLGVRPGYPAVARMVRKVLQPGETFRLDPALAADMIPDGVEAAVKISATLPLNMRDTMRGLIAYPYGCLEQTSSRAFPLLYATPERVTKLNLVPISHTERIRRLERAIERLGAMQTSTGGFALWNSKGPEEPWLTAYVTDFFLQARDMGLSVPKGMMDRAFKRLEYYVQKGATVRGDRHTRAELDFAVRSYAAFVLAKVGRAPLGTLRTYYDKNKDKAGSGLPLAHMGLALKLMGDQVRSGEALVAAAEKRRKGYGYWGDYGSPMRDLALTLALFVAHDVNAPGIEKMMLELDDALRRRSWLSTQEKFSLFKLGLAMESLSGKPWTGVLTVAGRETTLEQDGAYILGPTPEDIAGGVIFQSRSEGILFVSAVVNGYTRTPPAKDDSKILIKRTLYDLKGKPVEDWKFGVGDLALVHLMVEADEHIPDGLLVDLLPAGFEIENPNLKYSVKLSNTELEEIEVDGKPVWRRQNDTHYLHQEFRDDRYVAAVSLYKGRPSHLFYIVRVVTPGTFVVPPTLVESMYRPEIRGVGETPGALRVINGNR